MIDNHPVLVEVRLRDNESQEKLLRRFLKKSKKAEISREYIDKTMFALTRSQKRRAKIQKNKHLRELEARKLARKRNDY